MTPDIANTIITALQADNHGPFSNAASQYVITNNGTGNAVTLIELETLKAQFEAELYEAATVDQKAFLDTLKDGAE